MVMNVALHALVFGMVISKRPEWSKIETLADKSGTKAPHHVGLTGTVRVDFLQANTTKTTMAYPGQPLKQVAMQADQFIRYKCGKGECGTCEVNIDGKWVRTCSATVPPLDVTQTLQITVKPSMVAPTKKSSRFFSFT